MYTTSCTVYTVYPSKTKELEFSRSIFNLLDAKLQMFTNKSRDAGA